MDCVSERLCVKRCGIDTVIDGDCEPMKNHEWIRLPKRPTEKAGYACAARIWLACSAGALLNFQGAWAFENAKVMPGGVNRLTFRVVHSDFSSKTDGAGTARGLEDPIEQDLTFKDVLKNEKDLQKRELTAGFMAYGGFGESEALGKFTADLEGRVTVYAPIYTRGMTDRLTVAVALPVYDMALNLGVGFRAAPTADAFKLSLADTYNNQAQGARDFVDRINDAVGRLNTKLVDNGYSRLEPWQEAGVGDLQVLAKYAFVNEGPIALAGQGGLVAPTGRTDDPDNLIDAGFGDGQWDAFVQLSADQPLGDSGVFFNQYAKYTYQFADRKSVRLKTPEESIEVEKSRVGFKLGDKVNAGASVQYGADFGLTSGVGYNYYRKDKDAYDAGASAGELEKDTFQQSHEAEVALGYSGVPAFRRKEIPVPFEVSLSYKHQLSSQNMPVTHFIQLETGVFF